MNIAVVVPTCREEKWDEFMTAWTPLFKKHNITLWKVQDGNNPTVQGFRWIEETESITGEQYSNTFRVLDVMGKESNLIYNHNDGVRNLGFMKAFQDGADIIISLDDDVLPIGDTIQDHIDALNSRFPISWMNTTDEIYMRGFPYNLREEAECVLSHGTWQGVADFDASTQLLLGTPKVTTRRMPVPKGVLFPMCIMNVAFKRCMMPYMYQAPMFGDINRFADIWSGIEAKKAIDEHNWCAVTGYSEVQHNRASNPFTNLVKEARGVGMNERYGIDDYFELFKEKANRWKEICTEEL